MKDLLDLAEGRAESIVRLTVQKLATASLLEVFVDLIPDYPIREKEEAEKTQKVLNVNAKCLNGRAINRNADNVLRVRAQKIAKQFKVRAFGWPSVY